jgi:hypothetical protein
LHLEILRPNETQISRETLSWLRSKATLSGLAEASGSYVLRGLIEERHCGEMGDEGLFAGLRSQGPLAFGLQQLDALKALARSSEWGKEEGATQACVACLIS